ncbi:MAG: HAD family hydrolase [Tannerella sp.]|jgi:putative hydrolase of the HAD superfamily|nr:HAD family hydrolase [Tannerella sp.]
MKLSVKGLIFDYGGTIDTNGVHWGEVIRQVYTDFGVPVSRDQYRDAYVHVERTLGNQPIIFPDHTFRDILGIKIKLQFETLGLNDMSQANEIAEACYEKTVQTIQYTSKILDELAIRYPMILVSNFYGNLRTVLDEFGLTNYFREIIESAEVGLRKPDPAIYKLSLEKFGFKANEVVIIGDSYKNDIAPANALGCPSIWLKGKGWDDKDEAIEHPFIIKDFAGLKEILF